MEDNLHFIVIDKTTPIPPDTTHLTFADDFNSEIKNLLPPNLIYLTIGKNFNQHLTEHNIPKSVKYIKIPTTAKLSYFKIPVISIEWSTQSIIFQLRE